MISDILAPGLRVVFTMETIERFIVTPGAIDPAPPHPTSGGQRPLWL